MSTPPIPLLIAQGGEQTGRKYRSVARLPPGMTGLQALKERAPEEYAKVMRQAEDTAARAYRIYEASKHGDAFVLTVAEFNEFLTLTGRKPNTFLEQDHEPCGGCQTLGHLHAANCPKDPLR